ncbi:MAG TPA: DUF3383 family protein [Vicinamibacterales bacterium]|nr:DUF3383 family protein [Vicinamibacterales bacterium]
MADVMDTVVSVTITRETRTPSQRGFGVPLIVGYHDAWSDRVRSYADQGEMLDDGFTLTDPSHEYLYNMVAAMKAQSPSPSEIRIGRCANAFTQVVHLIPRISTAGYEYSFAIDGTTYTYETTGSEGLTGVVDALVLGLSGAEDVTVTDGVTWAVVTADTPGVIHSFVAKRGLDLYDATGTSGLTADLEAIAEEDDLNASGPAYGWLLDCNSEARIDTFDAFLESRVALGVVQSADWDVKDAGETGDVATDMVGEAITRTGGIYHTQAIGVPIAAAWMAKELPKNPGQSTWAHKTLATIPADSLKSSERTAINAKRWSWYSAGGGINITFEGKTPAGEYLDLIHQTDFVTARVKEAVFGAFTNNDKIPQTDAGIETVLSQVRSVLKQCEDTGPGASFPIFAPGTIVVDALTMDDIATADRANRIMRGVRFQARFSGAFHKAVITGRVYI